MVLAVEQIACVRKRAVLICVHGITPSYEDIAAEAWESPDEMVCNNFGAAGSGDCGGAFQPPINLQSGIGKGAAVGWLPIRDE